MPPSQNLVQRILVAAIAIPAVVGIIWLGGWVLAATLAVLGVLGAHEIYDFGRHQGIEALERTGWIAAAATPLLTYWGKAPVFFLGAIWLMLTLALAMVRRGPSGRPLTSVSITLFGFVYASGMLTFLIAIRHGGGRGSAAAIHPAAYVLLTLFPLVITWICDTAAMAVGTAVGGPKLAPVLSPQKTQAGAVGGTLGGVITALALGKFVLNRHGWGGWSFSDGQLLLFGLAVSIVGQIGDIAESLFKREAGVKDSSALIPGHGGVLDRLDSLYFVIPTAAGLYRMFGMI